MVHREEGRDSWAMTAEGWFTKQIGPLGPDVVCPLFPVPEAGSCHRQQTTSGKTAKACENGTSPGFPGGSLGKT